MPATIKRSGRTLGKKLRPSGPIDKAQHDALKRLMEDSAEQFVGAIVRADTIAIETGMSYATLLPLTKFLKSDYHATILSNVLSRRTYESKKGYTTMAGTATKLRKNVAFGQRLGKKAFRFRFGSLSRPAVKFQFDIRVFQYAFHEPRWHSLPIGTAAALAFITNNWKKYIINPVEYYFWGEIHPLDG